MENKKETLEEILENAAAQPKRAVVDDQTVEQHSLKDMIELDRYLSSKKTARKNRTGLRFSKMISDGAV